MKKPISMSTVDKVMIEVYGPIVRADAHRLVDGLPWLPNKDWTEELKAAVHAQIDAWPDEQLGELAKLIYPDPE